MIYDFKTKEILKMFNDFVIEFVILKVFVASYFIILKVSN